ncbi:hypothetical protein GCM10022222_81020 [Amycolatopsis ultiminotia]|uniref:Uncharacterized protein n=1 Tax=Amycolatopsis ultiminotia TaxID=543629 RepID=A0ABP6YJF1_9PSEU
MTTNNVVPPDANASVGGDALAGDTERACSTAVPPPDQRCDPEKCARPANVNGKAARQESAATTRRPLRRVATPHENPNPADQPSVPDRTHAAQPAPATGLPAWPV